VSLLSIVQDAWDRLAVGDTTPATVIGSQDASVQVLRALARQEGRELAARGTWQALTKEASITTTATQIQAGAIPADFSRMIPDTIWNYTEREPLLGPLSPEDWQHLSAGLVGPPDLYYRIRGNELLILPDPPAGETIKFEYVSRWWVDTDADGIADADDFTADTDVPLLSAELMTLGIMWRWLKRNRLPYADEFTEYDVQMRQTLARDATKGTVNMGGRRSDRARFPRVPDGSWSL
jgi:hypothetical protein